MRRLNVIVLIESGVDWSQLVCGLVAGLRSSKIGSVGWMWELTSTGAANLCTNSLATSVVDLRPT